MLFTSTIEAYLLNAINQWECLYYCYSNL